ncbi:MAG TPA: hypothetical protein VFJ58_27000 [Armatimonadota bacterium]|nr:hypothetical protein [Armatimonadota bacterium]
MTCNHCNTEYPGDVTVCPKCSQPLEYGSTPSIRDAESFAPGAESFAPANEAISSQFDLSVTVAVSGSASIRSRLRPRTVLEIIGESFSLYSRHWKLFAAVVLCITSPVLLFELLDPSLTGGQMLGGSHPHMPGVDFLLFMLLAMAVFFLNLFALTRAISEIYLGRNVSAAEVIRPNNRFWGFLGAMCLSTLAIFGVYFVGFFVLFAVLIGFAAASHGMHGPSSFTAIFGVMFLMIAVILVLMLFTVVGVMLAGPAAAVEGKGAVAAIERSLKLQRGFLWKGVGLTILCGLGYSILQSIILSPYYVIVFGAMMQTMAHPNVPVIIPFSERILGMILACVASATAVPLFLIPIVLYYYDLRIRKEAFDLQMLSEQLGYGVETPAYRASGAIQ